MGALWAKRRKTLRMRSQWCIDECVRKVVEPNGARAYRRGAAAATRVQSQQHHASLPPHRARATTIHFSMLLLKMLRRHAFAKDAGFSAASPRAPKSHTFHKEKGPFAKGRLKSEKATSGDPQVADNTRENTVPDRIGGIRASRGI